MAATISECESAEGHLVSLYGSLVDLKAEWTGEIVLFEGVYFPVEDEDGKADECKGSPNNRIQSLECMPGTAFRPGKWILSDWVPLNKVFL